MRLTVHPAALALGGRYRPPGDKSVSHRAAILGGLAGGETEIHGFLDSADTRATLGAMQQLGARVEESGGVIRIRGGSLKPPAGPLDLGNSGTGIRLLAGALAGHPDLQGAAIELVGDESLSRRPMARIIEPLARMGARIQSRDGRAPLVIEPSKLTGRRHTLSVASAQVKSAILLAGLFAEGETVVVEPGVSRDHTERMLPAFGVGLHDGEPGVAVSGGQVLSGTRIKVPGDLSSAAFALAAGLLVGGSAIQLEGIGLNPTRSGFVDIVRHMGAQVAIEGDRTDGGEPLGRLTVEGSALAGIDIAPEQVPLAIDEFPLIMALAAAAEGVTRIRGASELRVKESDRIAVMCRELARLGVAVEELDDGAVVTGGPVRGGEVDSHGDHRVAMSLAVLALVAEAPVTIDNAEWIETSYPGFVEDIRALGAEMVWE
ncbi:3-phosphoshikimate 1-carboxyvinyltransferase [Wenzhouxiangella sediminis]|uniref:3-phosphoshikimate 1-carboxyvinyltransferase n=1 Tax=Wenzhouxiangella sediminis TaxID=1792836 RepID=A0A3E1K9L7_9GAMM|nr:3-phosphoshikimate 1-carboxyvinyltransferase [Wenzhouxiangella sediminis]RFF30908.1 3-phosphoshikimate 1-carboxyvinyltransferase [Wenzhouxiangella sediminis]